MLIRLSCQGGERLGENLQSSSYDSDSGEVEAVGEEVEAGVRCSSSSDWTLSPRLALVSSQGEERSAGCLQMLGGWVWLVAGHLHSSCSLIGQCSCQWGLVDCSYYGFLENHH